MLTGVESQKNNSSKNNHTLFIKPFKSILIDIGLFFLMNFFVLFGLLFLTSDTSVAMINTIWAGVIAWRGGVLAGLLGTLAMTLSNYCVLHIPPHEGIPLPYYFDGRIPGSVIGLAQSLVGALIVGYISSLVHKLRNEVSLRKKAQAELEQKIAELNAFGHTVAHDLKNPLMIINMSIDALSKESAESGNEKIQKMITFIKDGTANMVNIIESLLTFAGIRTIPPSEYKNFTMDQCVESALKRLAYNIESNNVRVIKPGLWPSVFGHAPWITEVWVNYISNAIKYGGNPSESIVPEIELGYDKQELVDNAKMNFVRFWIKDNGSGIPEEKTPTLFKEFSRLHTSCEGHGLGLSIVKSVVEKLGGNVGVEHNNARGCCFYFTLPVNSNVNTSK